MKRFLKSLLKKIGLLSSILEWQNRFFRNSLPYRSQSEWKNRQKQREKLFGGPKQELAYENIFMIVVDCLRADHMGFQGYSNRTTPFIDSIAKNSIVGLNHSSTSSWTYPSVISLLTGLYPVNHGGVLKNTRDRYFYHDKASIPGDPDDQVVFLTDYLDQLGFQTQAFVSVLTAGLAIKGRFQNMESRDQDCDLVFDWVKQKLEVSRRNFFYLQLWDLHEPVKIIERRNYRPLGQIDKLEGIERWQFVDGQHLDSDEFERYRENKIRLYDTALRFVDDQIKQFVNYLEQKKKLERSLIIITSDHGEEFWEHAALEKQWGTGPRKMYGIGHGHTLFEELIHIPLIIYTGISGSLAPREIEELTSSVDVFPTILSLLDIQPPNLKLDGRLLLTDNSAKRKVFAEEIGYGDEIKVARRGNEKVFHRVVQDEYYQVNLDKDPTEQYLRQVYENSKSLEELKKFSDLGTK